MTEKKVDSFDLIDKLLDTSINEPKYLMSENTERKNKEKDLNEKRIRDIEEELKKLKGRVESEEQITTEDTRWTTTRPMNRISSMRIPASLKDDLFDEKIGDESQADVIKRILGEVREYREILCQIMTVLESEDADPKKVEEIKKSMGM